jgi:hypothetical protein
MYTPITKEQLAQVIAKKFGQPEGVIYNGDAIVTFLTDNIQTYTKTRLDEVEFAFDTLLAALSTMAAAFTATGAVPVTGAALGTALTTLVTTASSNVVQRATDKAAQSILAKPYFDGVK